MTAVTWLSRVVSRQVTFTMFAGVLLAQTIEIPSAWLKASPKEVLADLEFHRLDMTDRSRIMSELDPDFRKLSDEKKYRFLRGAERASLPKVGAANVVRRWEPKDPDSKLELRGSLAVKTLKTPTISVTASLEKNWGFLDALIVLRNESSKAVAVVPETFTLGVIRPKKKILLFEFPRTVAQELLWGVFNYSPPPKISTATLDTQTTTSSTKDPLSVVTHSSTGTVTYRDFSRPIDAAYTSVFKFAIETSWRIQAEGLKSGSISPGGILEGHVWFALSKILSMWGIGENVKADEVILTIFVQDTAFEIPFNLKGR